METKTFTVGERYINGENTIVVCDEIRLTSIKFRYANGGNGNYYFTDVNGSSPKPELTIIGKETDVVKHRAEVMNEYSQGKKVQYKGRNTDMNWCDIGCPSWDWPHNDYRVKPEPKRVPLTHEDLEERVLTGKTMWMRHKPSHVCILISRFSKVYVSCIGNGAVSYADLMEDFEFVNGDKTYKEEEE